MTRTERDELRARLWVCIEAGALEQAALILKRVHRAGWELLPSDYARLPLGLVFP